MIRVINGLKILTKHMSCEFKCKVDNGKCNSHQKWINDKCRYKSKNLKKKHFQCEYKKR